MNRKREKKPASIARKGLQATHKRHLLKLEWNKLLDISNPRILCVDYPSQQAPISSCRDRDSGCHRSEILLYYLCMDLLPTGSLT